MEFFKRLHDLFIKDGKVVTDAPEPVRFVARAPHCDSQVLHAPGECLYCDLYPEQQRLRERNGINFTGQYFTDKAICPSEIKRHITTIERWPGNRPERYDNE